MTCPICGSALTTSSITERHFLGVRVECSGFGCEWLVFLVPPDLERTALEMYRAGEIAKAVAAMEAAK